jgi:phosphomevalonate kinase
MIIDAWDLEDLKKQMQENELNDLMQLEEVGIRNIKGKGGIIVKTNVSEELVFFQRAWKDNEIMVADINSDDRGDYFSYEEERYYLKDFIRRGDNK